MRSLESSSANAFSSLETHSTESVIPCVKQNQKSSLASWLSDNLGLPLLMIPKIIHRIHLKQHQPPSAYVHEELEAMENTKKLSKGGRLHTFLHREILARSGKGPPRV